MKTTTSYVKYYKNNKYYTDGGNQMLKFLKWDLKLKVRSSFTIIIIFLFLFISFVCIHLIEEKRTYRSFTTKYATDSFVYLNQMKWSDQLQERDKIDFPKSEYTYKLYDDVRKNIWELSFSDDYKEVNRLQSFLSLLTLRTRFLERGIEEVKKDEIISIWENVSNDVLYDNVDFYVREKGESDFPKNMFLLQARYFETLYLNDLNMAYDDEVSNVSFLYFMYDKAIPLFIIVLGFLLVYPSINRSINNGQVKLLLTSGQHRRNIFIGKWISNVTYIWILTIPLSVIVAFLAALKGELVSLSYPMVILKDPFINFKGIPNYFDIAVDNGRYASLYPNSIGRTAPLGEYFMYGGDISASLSIISFIEFMLLAVILLSLFITFLVAFIQLFSVIFKSEFVSLITSIIFFGFFYSLSLSFVQGNHVNLSPFNLFNAIRVIEGVYNTTFIVSFVTLIICTILLILIGNYLFSKKEI